MGALQQHRKEHGCEENRTAFSIALSDRPQTVQAGRNQLTARGYSSTIRMYGTGGAGWTAGTTGDMPLRRGEPHCGLLAGSSNCVSWREDPSNDRLP